MAQFPQSECVSVPAIRMPAPSVASRQFHNTRFTFCESRFVNYTNGTGTLTSSRIDDALVRLVTRENSSYTQIWNSLARQQKIALKAVIEEGGTDLRSAAVLARYGIAASTMHKMLKVLDSRGLVREEETIGSIRYRLEDPFFARWLRLVQASA